MIIKPVVSYIKPIWYWKKPKKLTQMVLMSMLSNTAAAAPLCFVLAGNLTKNEEFLSIFHVTLCSLSTLVPN